MPRVRRTEVLKLMSGMQRFQDITPAVVTATHAKRDAGLVEIAPTVKVTEDGIDIWTNVTTWISKEAFEEHRTWYQENYGVLEKEYYYQFKNKPENFRTVTFEEIE